ncbi:MAG TPA: hypothetical protein EYG05_02940 [Candidatus Thioglobus autotrophicus]|nr:hypothetical protein [Candidatus Thioglobus autotrophicus]
MSDKITIVIEGKNYELANPENNFEVYSQALSKSLFDRITAGKIIFDSCYLGGAEGLVEIQNNVKLYSNICLYCASIVDFMEGEVKKNLTDTKVEAQKK